MSVRSKGQGGGYVIAKFHASGFISLNSANPVVSANSSSRETVRSMNIISADWTIANGASWTVARGGNTILVLSEGQSTFDFSDGRILDNVGGEASSNVVITKNGSSPATLVLKLHKQSSITGGSQY